LTENQVLDSLTVGLHYFTASITGPTVYEKGHRVARLFEALCYKPEFRGLDSRCCHWNLFPAAIWSWGRFSL